MSQSFDWTHQIFSLMPKKFHEMKITRVENRKG